MSAVDVYFAAYSRDPRVQLPALIAIRRAKIADLEACQLLSRRGKQRLYRHRRMLRSYEEGAARMGLAPWCGAKKGTNAP